MLLGNMRNYIPSDTDHIPEHLNLQVWHGFLWMNRTSMEAGVKRYHQYIYCYQPYQIANLGDFIKLLDTGIVREPDREGNSKDQTTWCHNL
jgi:hypothetical protein